MQVTEAQAAAIATEAAKKAVSDVFLALGIDTKNPLAAQQDFAHLHKQRIAAEEVGKWTKFALLGALFSGAVAVFLTGLHYTKF